MKTPWWRKTNQSWTVTLPNGKQKTLGKDPFGASRKHPPEEIVKKWHAALHACGPRQTAPRRPADLPLSEIRDRYLAYLEHPGTQEKTRSQWKQFLAFTGDMPVSALRVHHVADYLKSRKDWSSTSKATALERITTAINWAIGQQYVDPSYRLEFPRTQRPKRTRRQATLSADVQSRLEAAANPALRVMLQALSLSGARPNELCTATIENCDLKGRVLKVLNKTRHKTGIPFRSLYLSPPLVELIKEEIGGRTTGLIFRNNHGTAWKPREIAAQVRRRARRLNLPEGTTPYLYRHQFASDAINQSDANPAILAKLLGHCDLKMLLSTYFHEDPEAMKKAMEQITKKGS